MTLRKGTEIVLNPNSDFIRVDRDIEWGLKVTHTDEFKFVAIFFRQVGGSIWQAHVLSNMGWQGEVTDMSVREWFIAKILPALQKWVSETFPKTGENLDPQLKLSLELDALIVKNLKVTQNPDNTLTVFVS